MATRVGITIIFLVITETIVTTDMNQTESISSALVTLWLSWSKCVSYASGSIGLYYLSNLLILVPSIVLQFSKSPYKYFT